MSEPACAPSGHGADNSAPVDMRIESPPEIPLADAMASWRQEARKDKFNTGRRRLEYFVWGRGPAIVFIPGLCDRAVSFVPMMAALRRQFTCISYELPDGARDGARLAGDWSQPLVSELLALLDRLSVGKTSLFGSSFGSTIALTAMLSNPDRIERSIFQGGFAFRQMSAWERVLCRFLRYCPGPMGTLPLRRHLHPRSELAIFRMHGKLEMWDFLVENSNSVAKAAAAWRGLSLERYDLRRRLPTIRQPVLLISGEYDSIVPKSCDDDLMAGLPQVGRAEVPNCGHYPQYTHAALVAELIRQFLTTPLCALSCTADR
jgi:pimeloyl-ACP methyl ester carboxylesterase